METIPQVQADDPLSTLGFITTMLGQKHCADGDFGYSVSIPKT
jgi:hypothetical protein